MQADPGNVNQVLDQVVQKAKSTTAATQNATANAGPNAAVPTITPISDSVPSSYNKATIGIRQLATGFAMAQGAIAAVEAAIRSVVNAFKDFINVNSQMEQIQMQFKVMIGDAQKYKEIFAETKKLADVTPFSDLETYRAGQQLLAAQIKDIDEYKAALATVADLAAGSGRSIQEAAGAYSRLKSGATGEAMEALRLMNISRTMFEAKGINFDASGQALATSEQLVKTLNEIVKSNFGGLTQELSTKWSGLWSTFSSNIDNATRAITGGSFIQLESGLDGINKALDAALKDPDQKLKRLGDAIAGITGAVGQLASAFNGLFSKGGSSAMQLITEGLAMVNLGLSTLAFLTRQAQAAMQFLWDTMTFSDNARQNFVTNMQEATSDYLKQINLVRGAFGIQSAAAEDAAETQIEASKRSGKEQQETAIKAAIASKELVSNIKTVMAVQESAWAVDKAKGRDAVQMAQMEMEQRKVNLDTLQAAEANRQASIEAQGLSYRKSAEYLDAEAKYAQALEKYYDALIAKKEAMGGFITNTNKLLAEADAIDQRGGDSGVKRYEALKTAVNEYLDGLKKMRDTQIQAAANSAKMQAAAEAAQNGNLSQYQTMSAAIDQGEKMFQIGALQERLAQIQQLSQAQNLGARERFSLYEQERNIFAELTGSIGSAIADTMQKIESLQSKALGAASSAVGILDKIGATKSDYSAVASMVSGLRLNMGEMSMQNLGQMASLADTLKKKGVSASDLMPSSGDVLKALQREFSGVPETINKLQAGLQSLVGLSAQIGAMAADNFWAPWNDKLAMLKAEIASLANTNLNPLNYTPPPVPIPESNTGKAENKTVNVNQQTSLNIQGSTLKDIEGIVNQAKEKFGADLYAALQEANTQFGFV